jgi:hypothetical protein
MTVDFLTVYIVAFVAGIVIGVWLRHNDVVTGYRALILGVGLICLAWFLAFGWHLPEWMHVTPWALGAVALGYAIVKITQDALHG